jgi:hypothetical protein
MNCHRLEDIATPIIEVCSEEAEKSRGTPSPIWGTAKASQCKLDDGIIAWDVDLGGGMSDGLDAESEYQTCSGVGHSRDVVFGTFPPRDARHILPESCTPMPCPDKALVTSRMNCCPPCDDQSGKVRQSRLRASDSSVKVLRTNQKSDVNPQVKVRTSSHHCIRIL